MNLSQLLHIQMQTFLHCSGRAQQRMWSAGQSWYTSYVIFILPASKTLLGKFQVDVGNFTIIPRSLLGMGSWKNLEKLWLGPETNWIDCNILPVCLATFQRSHQMTHQMELWSQFEQLPSLSVAQRCQPSEGFLRWFVRTKLTINNPMTSTYIQKTYKGELKQPWIIHVHAILQSCPSLFPRKENSSRAQRAEECIWTSDEIPCHHISVILLREHKYSTQKVAVNSYVFLVGSTTKNEHIRHQS